MAENFKDLSEQEILALAISSEETAAGCGKESRNGCCAWLRRRKRLRHNQSA